MASPQVEDGHTRIANELLWALIRAPIGDMARVLLWIARNSYGWQQAETKLSPRSIANSTGLPERQVYRVLAQLKRSGMVASGGIQKDYEKWAFGHPVKNDMSKMTCHPGHAKHVTQDMLPSYNKEIKKLGDHVIDVKKQGARVEPQGFQDFWNSYPRKVAKGAARKAWLRLRPDAKFLETILRAIAFQKPLWKDPQYIKHPATWLNQECWTDEVITSQQGEIVNGIRITRRSV